MEFLGAAKDAAILGLPVNEFLPIWEKEEAQREQKGKQNSFQHLKDDKLVTDVNRTCADSQAENLPGACSKSHDNLSSELMSAITNIEQEVSGLKADKTELSGLKEDIKDLSGLREDIQQEVSVLKADIQQEVSGLKADIQQEVFGLKADIQQEVFGLKADIQQEVSGLREDIQQGVSSLKAGIQQGVSSLKADIQQGVSSLKADIQEVSSWRADIQQEVSVLKADITQVSVLRADVQQEVSVLKADITQEVSVLREDTQQEVSGLREDIQKGVSSLKADIQQGVSSLKADIQQEVSGLREEILQGVSGLREDIQQGVSSLKADIQQEVSGLREDILQGVSGLREDIQQEVSVLKADIQQEVSGLRTDAQQQVSGLRTDMLNRTEELLDIFHSLYSQQKDVLDSMNKDIQTFMRDIMDKHKDMAKNNFEVQNKYETLLEELLRSVKCSSGHTTTELSALDGPTKAVGSEDLVAGEECRLAMSPSGDVTTGINDCSPPHSQRNDLDLSPGHDIRSPLPGSLVTAVPREQQIHSDKSSSNVEVSSVSSTKMLTNEDSASIISSADKTVIHCAKGHIKSLLDIHVHLIGSHCECQPVSTNHSTSDVITLVSVDESSQSSVPCSKVARQESTKDPSLTEADTEGDKIAPEEIETDTPKIKEETETDTLNKKEEMEADTQNKKEEMEADTQNKKEEMETDTQNKKEEMEADTQNKKEEMEADTQNKKEGVAVDEEFSNVSSEKNSGLVCTTKVPECRNGRCINMFLYGVNFSMTSNKVFHDSSTKFFTSYYDVLRKSCKVRVIIHFDASHKLCVSVEITLVNASLIERWPLYIQADGYLVLGPPAFAHYIKVYDIKSQCPRLEEDQIKILAAAVCLRPPMQAYRDVTYQQLIRMNYDYNGFFNFKWRVLAS